MPPAAFEIVESLHMFLLYLPKKQKCNFLRKNVLNFKRTKNAEDAKFENLFDFFLIYLAVCPQPPPPPPHTHPNVSQFFPSGSRGKWGKADYLRNSMQYFFTECLYLTTDFSIGEISPLATTCMLTTFIFDCWKMV